MRLSETTHPDSAARHACRRRFPAVVAYAGALALALLTPVAIAAAMTAAPQAAPAIAAPDAVPAVDAAAVVKQAIEELRGKAMRRDRVDWTAMAREADARLARGEALQPVLEWIVARLEDGHSRVLTPTQFRQISEKQAGSAGGGAAGAEGKRTLPAPIAPSGRLLSAPGGCTIGYLRVPYLISVESEAMGRYANTLVALQKDLVARGATGWVVDLRGNIGGNQWPMLASLSGILGDGEHGAVIAPDGNRMPWGTRPGAAWAMSPDQTAVPDASLIAPDTSTWPVAVLQDRSTASSGEAIAISFRGRARTRSFGEASSGKSSANTLIPLAHGGAIALTTSAMLDRGGKAYGGPLVPDETLELPPPERGAAPPVEHGQADPAIDASLRWLGRTCAE